MIRKWTENFTMYKLLAHFIYIKLYNALVQVWATSPMFRSTKPRAKRGAIFSRRRFEQARKK